MQLKDLKDQVQGAINDKRDIVFVDECMFTFSTLPKKSYAAKGNNVEIDPKEAHTNTLALVAGIDATQGMVNYDVFDGSVNQEKFKEFIQNMANSLKGRQAAIFMDNLSVHKCSEVQKEFKIHSMVSIFNLPYSPEWNPIETFFAHVKGEFRKIKLEVIVNNLEPDNRAMIHQAVGSRSMDSIKKVAKSGIDKIMRIW